MEKIKAHKICLDLRVMHRSPDEEFYSAKDVDTMLADLRTLAKTAKRDGLYILLGVSDYSNSVYGIWLVSGLVA